MPKHNRTRTAPKKRSRRGPILRSEIEEKIGALRDAWGRAPTVAEVAGALGVQPGTLYGRLAAFRKANMRPDEWGFAKSSGRKRGRPAKVATAEPTSPPRLVTYVNNDGNERTVETTAERLPVTLSVLLAANAHAQPSTIRVWKPVKIKTVTSFEEAVDGD